MPRRLSPKHVEGGIYLTKRKMKERPEGAIGYQIVGGKKMWLFQPREKA